MFLKRILPIGIILLSVLIGFWYFQNPCIETVDITSIESWKDGFEVKAERIPESCSFGAVFAGANYIFSARVENSENWQKIMTIYHDDPIDIPRESLKIINEKVAFAFMYNKLAVTNDGAKTWNMWDVTKLPNWDSDDLGYIENVEISADGIGSVKLKPISQDVNKVVPEFYSNNFGKIWKQIK